MSIHSFFSSVVAVTVVVLFNFAHAHQSGGNHDSESVACCIHGSIAGTPGGVGGSPTEFCENPNIKFKRDSGKIGDQLFPAQKCDKYFGLVSGDSTIRPGQTHNRPGVSCHYGSIGFRVMCQQEATKCEDSSCGRTRKAGS